MESYPSPSLLFSPSHLGKTSSLLPPPPFPSHTSSSFLLPPPFPQPPPFFHLLSLPLFPGPHSPSFFSQATPSSPLFSPWHPSLPFSSLPPLFPFPFAKPFSPPHLPLLPQHPPSFSSQATPSSPSFPSHTLLLPFSPPSHTSLSPSFPSLPPAPLTPTGDPSADNGHPARLNSDQMTAASILQHIDEDSLYKVLKFYGEEKNARKIARALVESRYLFRKLETTKELAELVMTVIGQEYRLDKLQRSSHPATKTFQALRILVNNELNELEYGLRLAHFYLQPGASLVAISFHSLEDTIIKRHITGMDIDKTPLSIGSGVGKHRSSLSTYSAVEMESMMKKPWAPLDKHVILPSEREVQKNPRSRSAKLRAARKC
ncbi:methyltransferase-like protein 15 [Penaeus vannamei]|uniref:Methyltransferase-like protein 15 n=1 Tax=Penaeus vannamei TaxID=6689 RepID=A0A3R7QXH0_PENVA|nr:methyltransferase-like protein 15 [Penaeus vannamei]